MRKRGIGLILFAVSTLLGSIFLNPLNPVERVFLDMRFVMSSLLADSAESSRSVAVVFMDSESEGALGNPSGSEWREFLPRVVEVLEEAGARVTVLDLEFVSDDERWDSGFAERIAAAGNVVAGETESGTTTPSLSGAFSGIGGLSVVAKNGVPRRVEYRDGLEPLSLLAARHFADVHIPASIAEDGGFWISFTRPSSFFPAFSFVDVYNSAEGRMADPRRTPLSIFRNRAVLIGMDLPVVDRHVFPHTLGARIPGVFGHAYALETILSGEYPYATPWWIDLAVLIAFSALMVTILESTKKAVRMVLTPLLPLSLLVAATVLLAVWNFWLAYAPVAVSAVVSVLLHWIITRGLLRQGLKRAIGFDPDLVDAFRRASTGGTVREAVAVLCADIRDYTAFVSGSDPSDVSVVMKEYLRAMEAVVSSRGGYINKYVGDEIVAVFGFPLDDKRRVFRAVRTGVEMLAALRDLTADWSNRGIQHFERIGIGIDCGTVTFTEVGGATKKQFDIIGNAINGASRIQTLTKSIDSPFAVSGEVVDALTEGIEDRQLKEGFNPFGAYSIRGQGERLVYGYTAKA